MTDKTVSPLWLKVDHLIHALAAAKPNQEIRYQMEYNEESEMPAELILEIVQELKDDCDRAWAAYEEAVKGEDL